MILGLQLISLVFVLMMMYFAYLHYRRGEINKVEILFLTLIWLGATLIIVFPELFTAFSRTIAISRTFDLAVICGFILVIPLVYLSYVKTGRLERKLEDFIRKEALKQIRSTNKNMTKKSKKSR